MKTVVKSLAENDLSLGGEAKKPFARTFSTLLTRDLSLGLDDSFLVQATKAVATTEEIEKIENNFPQAITFENYSLTHDQAERLKVYIENGGEYPSFNGYNYSWVDYEKVKIFLSDLKYVFMWETYEKSTLGNGNSTDWFALLLAYWIEGKPIAVIINEKIKKYDKGEYTIVFCNKQKYQYDGSIKHKNYIVNQILDDIDKILIFKLGDYFSIFSEEYKQQKGDDSLFSNDWATFVEYGTGNWKLIELQKLGFSRENAKYVFAHAEEYEVHFAGDNPDIEEEPDGYLTLGYSILDDPNSSIREEANEIYNIEPRRFKSLDSFYDEY